MGLVDEGVSCAGCSSPPGGIHYPKDVEDILQVQKTPPLRSLSLRERGASQILQGRYRQRAYAWHYRRDTVVWVPDKSSPAPPFSCFRGRFIPAGAFPQWKDLETYVEKYPSCYFSFFDSGFK